MTKLLDSVTVLDLCDEKGLLCGKLLADLGADVIIVEPPCGSPARKLGPFYKNVPHKEKSLYWYAYNTNKQGITLDITQPEGRRILGKLVEQCDILIETYPPNYLNGLHLGYDQLVKIKPDLIMISITPFGQNGPYSEYKHSDLIIMAMGGHPYISGDPGKEPLSISIPQSFLLSGAHSAMASLIALYYRNMTGEGQYIDVSMHECATWVSFNAFDFWELNQQVIGRLGQWRSFGLTRVQVLYACLDGYVSLWLLGGGYGAKGQNKLREWAKSEGMADDFWLNFDYENWDAASSTQEICDQMARSVGRFIATKTKAELFKKAIELGFFLAPVNTISDIIANEQVQSRGFFLQVAHPELGLDLNYPGAFIKMMHGPAITIDKRAPTLGEHNEQIYCGKLGFSRSELLSLRECGVI